MSPDVLQSYGSPQRAKEKQPNDQTPRGFMQHEPSPSSFGLAPTERNKNTRAPARQHRPQDITALDIIQSQDSGPDNTNELPYLPSEIRARELVDTVYFYTQARYCIIDWAQLREWHRERESIAYCGPRDPVDSQIGKYRPWVFSVEPN